MPKSAIRHRQGVGVLCGYNRGQLLHGGYLFLTPTFVSVSPSVCGLTLARMSRLLYIHLPKMSSGIFSGAAPGLGLIGYSLAGASVSQPFPLVRALMPLHVVTVALFWLNNLSLGSSGSLLGFSP